MGIWGTFLFSWILLATANIEVGPQTPDFGKRFSEIIATISKRVQDVSSKRPFKISAMNDSVVETARAAKGMASGWKADEIFDHLEKARSLHRENSFAILLQAVLRSSQGNTQEANQYFQEYLLNSTTFREFDKAFIRWKEYHMLRRTVYELLRSRGIGFEGREKQIQVRIPLEALAEYVMNPAPEDRAMNIAFIAFILGGGVFLGVAGLMGLDYSQPMAGSLIFIYIVIWIAYALWLLDLAFGLPFGLTRFQVIPVFLTITTVPLLLFELAVIVREKTRPLPEGTRRCPHCGKVILKIQTECEHCRHGV